MAAVQQNWFALQYAGDDLRHLCPIPNTQSETPKTLAWRYDPDLQAAADKGQEKQPWCLYGSFGKTSDLLAR